MRHMLHHRENAMLIYSLVMRFLQNEFTFKTFGETRRTDIMLNSDGSKALIFL